MFFLASIFYLISCKTTTNQENGIEKQLIEFAKAIIENPDKINNISKDFPEYYNENCYDSSMILSKEKHKLIEKIEKVFKEMDANEVVEYSEAKWEDLKKYLITTQILNDTSISNFKALIIWRDYYGIKFIFVQKGNKYYLCQIRFVVDHKKRYDWRRLDSILIEFARDVIENPEKLFNLEGNYPEFYNEDFIDNKSLRDSIHIRRLIDYYINGSYKKKEKSERIIIENESRSSLAKYTQINKIKNIKDSNILQFSLIKDLVGINFLFIKSEDKYYICTIGYSQYNP